MRENLKQLFRRTNIHMPTYINICYHVTSYMIIATHTDRVSSFK